ncbi:MAG: hypothetical protein ACLT16_09695 [[Clostridium] innocuum]
MGELHKLVNYITGSGTQKDEKQAYLCFSNAMELGIGRPTAGWRTVMNLEKCE